MSVNHAATAADLVLGDRNASYGSPKADFDGTGLIWTGLLLNKLKVGESVSAQDVALMMAGLKLRRQATKHKDDNIVDAHGYLLCLQWVITGEKPATLTIKVEAPQQ